MTKKTWLSDDKKDDDPITNDDTTADSLWTRRSALALTAGFFALSGTPGRAAAGFRHVLEPRADHVVISKKNRVLELKSGETTLRRYRISLGFAPDGPKGRSGDGRTPEGRYFIDRRNPRSEFYLSLGINYPNAQDLAKARAMGVDPGGDIFIHGDPVRGARRSGRDWTAGCIAVKNREMEEIWSMVPTGVPVTIFGSA
jgi:murein L,D-transpeptidase YafK